MSTITKSNDGGAAEVKRALRNLLQERQDLCAKLTELETAYSLSAWRPSLAHTGRSTSHKRLEAGVLRVAEVKTRIADIDSMLGQYVGVLRDHRDDIREAHNKILLMEQRYFRRREWDDICFEIYGGEADFTIAQKKYLRKLYRLYDSACAAIWDYWQTVGNGLPLSSSKGIDCRIWTAGEAVTKPWNGGTYEQSEK